MHRFVVDGHSPKRKKSFILKNIVLSLTSQIATLTIFIIDVNKRKQKTFDRDFFWFFVFFPERKAQWIIYGSES